MDKVEFMGMLLIIISIGQLRLYYFFKKDFFLIMALSGVVLGPSILLVNRYPDRYPYLLFLIFPFYLIFLYGAFKRNLYKRSIKENYLKKVNIFYKLLFPFGIIKKESKVDLSKIEPSQRNSILIIIINIIVALGIFLLFPKKLFYFLASFLLIYNSVFLIITNVLSRNSTKK